MLYKYMFLCMKALSMDLSDAYRFEGFFSKAVRLCPSISLHTFTIQSFELEHVNCLEILCEQCHLHEHAIPYGHIHHQSYKLQVFSLTLLNHESIFQVKLGELGSHLQDLKDIRAQYTTNIHNFYGPHQVLKPLFLLLRV